MAKQVKRGYDEQLPGQCRAQEHGGRLRISQGPEPDRLNSWVALPVEACEALGMTAALEDVPEPWERVHRALQTAWREERGREVGAFPTIMSDYDDIRSVCSRVAELLGIKPEGESWCLREASDEFRAATEAVAKARDAVVEAAKRTHRARGRFLTALSTAVLDLSAAEHDEAKARARLEALR